MTKTTTHFQCTVYLADGKHISHNEICETEQEAIHRAESWRALGHKAQAYLIIVDYAQNKIFHYPLA